MSNMPISVGKRWLYDDTQERGNSILDDRVWLEPIEPYAVPPISLSPITGEHPKAGTPLVYIGADAEYLRHFGPSFVHNLFLTNPDARLHIHILEPATVATEETIAKLKEIAKKDISTTAETEKIVLPTRAHYPTLRFIRLAELMRQELSVLALDIDTAIRVPLARLAQFWSGKDVAVSPITEYYDFSCRIRAAAIYLSGSKASIQFIRDAADRMRRGLAHGVDDFFMDTRALTYALRNAQELRLGIFPEEVLSVNDETAMVSTYRGLVKHRQVPEGILEPAFRRRRH